MKTFQPRKYEQASELMKREKDKAKKKKKSTTPICFLAKTTSMDF